MQKPECIQENEIHKIIWDVEIQIDHLIPARRSDLVVINKKKTSSIVDLAFPADHKVKMKESEKRHRYLNLVRELYRL